MQAQPTAQAHRRLWPYCLAAIVLLYTLIEMYWHYDPIMNERVFNNSLSMLIPAFCGIVLLRRDLRRQWTFRVLAVFALWMILAQALAAGWADGLAVYSTYTMLMIAFCAFPLAQVLPEARRQRVLHIVIDLFLLAFLSVCAVGLYAAFRQVTLSTPSSLMIGMLPVEKRLAISAHPNTVGTLCTLAISLAIYRTISTKSWELKGTYVAVAILYAVTLILTDSRTNLYATAVCVGGAGFLLVREKLLPRGALASWGVSLACWALVAALCVGGFRLGMTLMGPYVVPAPVETVHTLIERIRSDPDGLEAAKQIGEKQENPDAETANKGKSAPNAVTARDLMSDTLNGRTGIWRKSLEAIARDPHILLYGVQDAKMQETIHPVRPEQQPEGTHNALLSVLLRGGLPALLLAVGFLVLLALQSARLLAGRVEGRTLAQRYLPVVLLGMVIVSMVESQTFGTGFSYIDAIFFMVAGMVVSLTGGQGSEAR